MERSKVTKSNQTSKSLKESISAQRTKCGYRPNGNRSSELSNLPTGGTSIQNMKRK